MRFTDVDRQKIGAILVVVEDLRNVANLAAKGWSSKAAEDKHEWLAVDMLANLKMIRAI
jgi:hypothetical protein